MADVLMQSPDGKRYAVNVAEASEAKRNGWSVVNEPGTGEAALRGAVQGATLGWGDEAMGTYRAASTSLGDWLYEKLHPEDPTTSPSYIDRYVAGRDETRANNAAVKEAHPVAYGAGEFAGTIPVLAAAPATLPGMMVAGALSGAGESEATDLGQLALHSGGGALGGAVGYGVGKVASSALRGLSNKAATGAASAQAKAAELATKAKTAPVKAAEGAYGASRQAESRFIENLLRLEAEGKLPPQLAQELAALKASPLWQQAQEQLARNTMDALPGQLATTVAKRTEAEALRAALPGEIADETTRLLSPATMKDQVMARVKRYGWPMVGSAVGSVLGGPAGAAIGALGGAGMRPAARAWMNMARHPSVAEPLWNAVGGAASTAAKAAPVGATAAGMMVASPGRPPVPSPRELAQADPVIGEAFQRGGPEAAKAAFYAESQTRPEQLLGWLNEPKP